MDYDKNRANLRDSLTRNHPDISHVMQDNREEIARLIGTEKALQRKYELVLEGMDESMQDMRTYEGKIAAYEENVGGTKEDQTDEFFYESWKSCLESTRLRLAAQEETKRAIVETFQIVRRTQDARMKTLLILENCYASSHGLLH